MDKKIITEIIKNCHEEVNRSLGKEITDEMAIPAYTEGTWYSRIVFWGKLRHIIKSADLRPEMKIFDFGCGTGILLPDLATDERIIFATDLYPNVAKCLVRKLKLNSVNFLDSNNWKNLIPSRSLDLIIAANVLEHIEDRKSLLKIFKEKLKDDGRIIISGPTENRMYRLGRRIINFSGHYHVTDIFDIFDDAKNVGLGQDKLIKYPFSGPLCLYQIASFRKI